MNIIINLFAPWYEGWGTEDGYGAGDYFDGVVENADIGVLVNVISTGLLILTIVCAVGCVVFYIASRKVEPLKNENAA